MDARSVVHNVQFCEMSTSTRSNGLLNFDYSQVNTRESRDRRYSKENRGFGMAPTAKRYGCKKRRQVPLDFHYYLLSQR
ncbi:hypothetical protein BGZ76_006828, partial [Entomortierella beljakovae]